MNNTKTILRWALYVLLLLLIYQNIAALWLAVELALYGASQKSAVDAIVAMYLANRTAVWIMKEVGR